MIRSDHPSNTKRGGVCLYYKQHLPFVRRDDITSLDECIIGEIKGEFRAEFFLKKITL